MPHREESGERRKAASDGATGHSMKAFQLGEVGNDENWKLFG